MRQKSMSERGSDYEKSCASATRRRSAVLGGRLRLPKPADPPATRQTRRTALARRFLAEGTIPLRGKGVDTDARVVARAVEGFLADQVFGVPDGL